MPVLEIHFHLYFSKNIKSYTFQNLENPTNPYHPLVFALSAIENWLDDRFGD
jgi:hypothetical protein